MNIFTISYIYIPILLIPHYVMHFLSKTYVFNGIIIRIYNYVFDPHTGSK